MSGNGGQEEDKRPGKSSHINLKVNSNDAGELFFWIKRNTQLNKLMTAYCEQQRLEMKAIRFLFDGRRIKPHHTPEELEMEDGDEIDAMLEQISGGSGDVKKSIKL